MRRSDPLIVNWLLANQLACVCVRRTPFRCMVSGSWSHSLEKPVWRSLWLQLPWLGLRNVSRPVSAHVSRFGASTLFAVARPERQLAGDELFLESHARATRNSAS